MSSERALRHVARTADMVVVACGLSRTQRAHVADGLRRAECTDVATFDELERMLPTMPSCDALILAPRDHQQRDAVDVVRCVAREWPGTAIVIFCPPRTDDGVSFRALALAGAHQFVFEGMHNTAAALATAVEHARHSSSADIVLQKLEPLVPLELRSIVHVVLARPDTLTTVDQVAAALGVHRKTLVNRCARVGFIRPAELIVWCRLALVAYALGRSGATVEAIAHSLGFASHTALRNLLKRHSGKRATDIRGGGGLDVLLKAFAARLRLS
jgi:AraC-like DNA-binding protein